MDSDVESHGTHDEPLTILSLCDHLQELLIENGMEDCRVYRDDALDSLFADDVELRGGAVVIL